MRRALRLLNAAEDMAVVEEAVSMEAAVVVASMAAVEVAVSMEAVAAGISPEVGATSPVAGDG